MVKANIVKKITFFAFVIYLFNGKINAGRSSDKNIVSLEGNMEDLDMQIEAILDNIEREKSSDLMRDSEIKEKVADADSFVKFDTRKMQHFNIEDVTYNHTLKGLNLERIKYHRIVKSGIKFAEYSLYLVKKQKEIGFLSSKLTRKKKNTSTLKEVLPLQA